MVEKSDPNSKLIAENRRARFDFAIESDIEAGIMLLGSEVKSLRKGGSNIAESYAAVEEGELWLVNSYVAPYEQAKTWGHLEKRRRKLAWIGGLLALLLSLPLLLRTIAEKGLGGLIGGLFNRSANT